MTKKDVVEQVENSRVNLILGQKSHNFCNKKCNNCNSYCNSYTDFGCKVVSNLGYFMA